ncbi:MAG: GNAT family N-acetyltransferase [Proteobacteria bacterium]|nr:GNAT family N-acetyltransferase [Pseudomonadota bacterium]
MTNIPALSLPITTRRLHIREYVVADIPTVFQYVNDAAYWQYQRSEAPTAQQLDTLLKWVVSEQAAKPRLAYFLAATRKDTGEIIGEAVLKIVNPAERQAELGFGVAPRFWKQGFGTEIATALLDVAFSQLKMHRVSAQCSPENKGSIRVMQKTGMAREGLLRDVHQARGKWWSTVIYGVLEHEYAKIKTVMKG